MKVEGNKWLMERFYEAAGYAALPEAAKALKVNAVFDKEFQALNAELGITDKSLLKDIPEERRKKFKEKLTSAIHAKTLLDLGTDQNFAKMVEMINNQDQFYVTGTGHRRDELIGPNEFNIKLFYERGLGNIRSLRKAIPDCFGPEAEAKWAGPSGDCLDKYSQAVKNWNPEEGNRLSFSLEYANRESHHIGRPDIGLNLDKAGNWSLIGKAAYGRYLSINQDGQQSTRLDVSASWENVSDDPERQDRGVASVTFTQRINDDLSIPIALVYANHSKFKGEVDKDLSAHFGLSYKLARKKKEGS
jgi:hypothetical protein